MKKYQVKLFIKSITSSYYMYTAAYGNDIIEALDSIIENFRKEGRVLLSAELKEFE